MKRRKSQTHTETLQDWTSAIDELEREATRPVEMRLREEIRSKEISIEKLAELTGYLPIGAEFLLARATGYWSFRECLLVAKALGLKLHYVLREEGTTKSRLMVE